MKINFTAKTIDLHTHTRCSDGSLSPSELVRLAAASNLAAIAITDHDTVAGLEEGEAAAEEQGLELVPGVEVSAYYNHNKEIHLLGLYIDRALIASRLPDIQQSRRNRNIEMLSRFLDKGIQLELPSDIGSASRGHFGLALKNAGTVSTLDEAFQNYLSPGCSTFVPRGLLAAEAAIEMIRSCGGVPVLAHPMRYRMDIEAVGVMVRYLTDCGLMGLETYYPGHTADEIRHLLLWAKKYRLLLTGGTDFHGDIKPRIKLGVGLGDLSVPYKLLDALLKAAKAL